MKRLCLLGTTVLLLLGLCPAVDALTPQEVLVVANGDSPQSLSLARTYMELRGIPRENGLTINTSTDYNISRENYEKQIRLPIKKYLLEHKLNNRIRCICLIYGVPVRIEPAPLPPDAQQMFEIYTRAAQTATARLAVDRQLLAAIGKSFPQTQPQDLKPAASLFGPLPPLPSAASADFNKTLADVLRLLASKQVEVARIADPANRRIAMRQLMAVHLDVGGTQGLLNFVTTAKPADAPDIEALQAQLMGMEQQWTQLQGQAFNSQVAQEELALADRMMGLPQLHALASSKAVRLGPSTTDAAVDSELALVWWDNRYNPGGWIPNTLNWRSDDKDLDLLPPTVMTSRIDGPSKADVLRLIKTSVAVQKTGLRGRFYIDAGGVQPAYDEHLIRLAKAIKGQTRLPVVLDNQLAVFPPNSCPDAALYVGWCSNQKYVASCSWVDGAVGWHIASFEAQHLRDPNSRDWCPKMIQNGVAATIGAVNEPNLGAFPLPDEFFPLLLTGKFTVAECYWRTTPMASWRLTLIADPLYNPYQKNPQLDVKSLPKDLAPKYDTTPPPSAPTPAAAPALSPVAIPAAATAPAVPHPTTAATTPAPQGNRM